MKEFISKIPAFAGMTFIFNLCNSSKIPCMQSESMTVYILASKKNGVLYIGVTNDLKRRVEEHRTGSIPGFTSKYYVRRLVWYESTDSILGALTREKQLKKWKRDWKIRLVEEKNPEWSDLYESI